MKWFLLIVLLLVAGCAHVSIETDSVKASYTRWFDQNIEGFRATKDANGVWSVGFDKQLSETELAFRLGQMSVTTGGGH